MRTEYLPRIERALGCLSADDLWWRPNDACAVIEAQRASDLARPLLLQGFETSPLHAVYHVVEHFSWHTGQLVAIAKQRGGAAHGLAFYDDDLLNEQHNETRDRPRDDPPSDAD